MDLADLVLVLYAVGVSARVVGEVMEHLLGHRYSHSTVSRITELVLERVEAFRTRTLGERYAIVYLDCLFVKVLREGLSKRGGVCGVGVLPSPQRVGGGVAGDPSGPVEARDAGSTGVRERWASGNGGGDPEGLSKRRVATMPSPQDEEHPSQSEEGGSRAVTLELKRIYLAVSREEAESA